MAGGEVEGGEAISKVALNSDGSAEDAADRGGAPVVAHVIDRAVEAFLNEVGGEENLGGDFFPTSGGEGASGGFFVPGEVGFDVSFLWGDGRVFEDVIADRLGGDGDHVLAAGIGGVEVEVEVDVVALDGGADVDELAVGGGGESDLLEGFELGHGPHHELSGFGEVGEGEGGGSVDGLDEDHSGAAAGFGDE